MNETYYAYARGYYHGLEVGIRQNPYDGFKPEEAPLHQFYNWGYDKGVDDYCMSDDEGVI